MRAARPDYTRKSRHTKHKTKETKDAGWMEHGISAERSAGYKQQQMTLTSDGDIRVGGDREDERRWYEKW
jgi:hypothetical protein